MVFCTKLSYTLSNNKGPVVYITVKCFEKDLNEKFIINSCHIFFQNIFFGFDIIKSFVNNSEFEDLYNIAFLFLYLSKRGVKHLTGSRSLSV